MASWWCGTGVGAAMGTVEDRAFVPRGDPPPAGPGCEDATATGALAVFPRKYCQYS